MNISTNKSENVLTENHFLGKTDFDIFSYSRFSHLSLLEPYAREVGYDIRNLHGGDLSCYQATLVYAFVRINVPLGSRIIEISNAAPYVFRALSRFYEVWALVNPAHQSQWVGEGEHIIVGEPDTGTIGMPQEHFDAAYSVGLTDLLQSVASDRQAAFARALMRLLKPNAPSLHSFYAVIKEGSLYTHPVARVLAAPDAGRHWVAPEAALLVDADRMDMTEQAYQSGWQPFTNKSYADFGTPITLNLLENKANASVYEVSVTEPPTPETFNEYAYAKKSHLAFLGGLANDFFGHGVDFASADLKRYQDLLVYAFIRRNIGLGTRILDIGGGYSRVLSRLSKEYECWCLDKMEGQGKGPTDVINTPYRLVRDYMGNFNRELPDGYFDLVFSISTIEHIPFDQPMVHGAFIEDIDRVLKPGGYSLHAVDVCKRGDWVWHNPMLNAMYSVPGCLVRPVSWNNLLADPNVYFMSEAGFKFAWQAQTHFTYEEMGLPTSVNLLWQKVAPPENG